MDIPTLQASVSAAFNRHDWPQAHALARQLLAVAPRDAAAHYVAGIASLESNQVPVAIQHLGMAASLRPRHAEFVTQLARALGLARRNSDAKEVADRALALQPDEARVLDMLGVVYTQIGEHACAAEAFRRAVEREPSHALLRYNLATALVATGDLVAAEREIEACLAIDPRHWRAHLTSAQLRRQTPESNHLARLTALLPGLQDQAARVCVNMALAKEYEDLERYPEAFAHLTAAKSAGGEQRSYVWADDERLFRTIAESFPSPVAEDVGHATDEPIFVIGMPRTGTTLVERILSSHPQVHPAGELLNFPMSLKAASGSRTSRLIDVETIEHSRAPDWRSLGEAYLSSTRPVTGHTARFVDKLPHNFLYAGHIARALPNARIICLRRNPLDTCLSNFRQLFAPKSDYFEYSYDLLDTGCYFILFDRLMAHWREVLPGRILEVQYESLVQAQEAVSRQMIEFCGLSWDDACMRFESNPMPVATASAVQVRAPMYRSAVQRWRKYEAQLQPLIELLGASGIALER